MQKVKIREALRKACVSGYSKAVICDDGSIDVGAYYGKVNGRQIELRTKDRNDYDHRDITINL